MYTCIYHMAVIAVLSLMESLLGVEHLIGTYSEAGLISGFEPCFIASMRVFLFCVGQSNASELCLSDVYFCSSRVFHTMFLAYENQ
jgi:hypothetical protein